MRPSLSFTFATSPYIKQPILFSNIYRGYNIMYIMPSKAHKQLELSRAQNPRRVAQHLLHKLAMITSYMYIDLLSAHMLFKLKLRGVVPIWRWSKALSYLWSGDQTNLYSVQAHFCALLVLSFTSLNAISSADSDVLCYCTAIALLGPSGINWKSHTHTHTDFYHGTIFRTLLANWRHDYSYLKSNHKIK